MRILWALVVASLLFFEVALQSNLARAESGELDCNLVATSFISSSPTPKAPSLCGKLVFLTGYYPAPGKTKISVATIGLIPCGIGKPLIFQIHPRYLVPYYQFEGAEIGAGRMICTDQYGCLDQYILTFDTFYDLENCAQCGLVNLPPTWTHVPLTPFTPTLSPTPPPTPTPFPTIALPTPQPTQPSDAVLPSVDVFELLHTTPSPSPTLQPSPTETLGVQTGVLATPIDRPTAIAAQAGPLYQRIPAWGWMLLILLALIISGGFVLRNRTSSR